MLDIKRILINNSHIYQLEQSTLENPIYLFKSTQQDVNYEITTDGNIDHIDTWVDKKPYEKDKFLYQVENIKRYDFKITDANVVIIDKKYKNKTVRNLYINKEFLFKKINPVLNNVSINEKGNIKIKRMEI